MADFPGQFQFIPKPIDRARLGGDFRVQDFDGEVLLGFWSKTL